MIKLHVFTDTKMLINIIPVKYNVQILNGIKDSERGFGLVIIKPPQKIIIPLWLSYNRITIVV